MILLLSALLSAASAHPDHDIQLDASGYTLAPMPPAMRTASTGLGLGLVGRPAMLWGWSMVFPSRGSLGWVSIVGAPGAGLTAIGDGLAFGGLHAAALDLERRGRPVDMQALKVAAVMEGVGMALLVGGTTMYAVNLQSNSGDYGVGTAGLALSYTGLLTQQLTVFPLFVQFGRTREAYVGLAEETEAAPSPQPEVTVHPYVDASGLAGATEYNRLGDALPEDPGVVLGLSGRF